MLHAYCVRRAGEPGPADDLRGIDGAPVRLLEVGDLALWLSEGGEGPPTVERLREHDRVVRAALRSATPLPIRYGAGLASEARARERVTEQREAFLASLDRVAGRVEMAVRVCWDRPEEVAEEPADREGMGPGRAYLARRRRESEAHAGRRREAEALLARMEAVVAAMELPTERRVLPESGVAGSLAHLVHRGEVRLYRERIEQAENGFFPIELHVSGPWAPYSFV